MFSEAQAQKFHQEGYGIIENFLTDEEIHEIRDEMSKIVEEMNPEDHQAKAFVAEPSKQKPDDYFLNSADKIRFFFEDGARDNMGKLVVDKQKALNKVGHALHVYNPAFKKFTFSEKIKDVVRKLGFKDPTVIQSMYIFKQPELGGVVCPHRDAWYLRTRPQSKLLGMWFALEDVTLENGCLWFVPGSHKIPDSEIETHFRRTPGEDGSIGLAYSTPPPKFEDVKWIPGVIKQGTAVLIHGLVLHKSEHNHSTKSRNAYTFHVIDQDGVQWDEGNWLQPNEEGVPFTQMFD